MLSDVYNLMRVSHQVRDHVSTIKLQLDRGLALLAAIARGNDAFTADHLGDLASLAMPLLGSELVGEGSAWEAIATVATALPAPLSASASTVAIALRMVELQHLTGAYRLISCSSWRNRCYRIGKTAFKSCLPRGFNCCCVETSCRHAVLLSSYGFGMPASDELHQNMQRLLSLPVYQVCPTLTQISRAEIIQGYALCIPDTDLSLKGPVLNDQYLTVI